MSIHYISMDNTNILFWGFSFPHESCINRKQNVSVYKSMSMCVCISTSTKELSQEKDSKYSKRGIIAIGIYNNWLPKMMRIKEELGKSRNRIMEDICDQNKDLRLARHHVLLWVHLLQGYHQHHSKNAHLTSSIKISGGFNFE